MTYSFHDIRCGIFEVNVTKEAIVFLLYSEMVE